MILRKLPGILRSTYSQIGPVAFLVLQSALKQNRSDSTALFLLGELYMAGAEVDKAIDAWEQARKNGYKRADLYRKLGRAYTELKKDNKSGLAVFEQGLKIAPADHQIQKGVQALFGPARNSTTPEVSATYALGLVAEGKLAEAFNVFNPEN